MAEDAALLLICVCAYFGHKVIYPHTPAGIVPRPRLVERLNEGLAYDRTPGPHLSLCRVWKNYPGQRMDRWLQTTGRLAVAG
jgi:hypothetical protein